MTLFRIMLNDTNGKPLCGTAAAEPLPETR